MASVNDIRIPASAFIQDTDSSVDEAQLRPREVGDTDYTDPWHRSYTGHSARVYVFDLSKEEDLRKYEETLEEVGTSPFTRIQHVSRQWDAARSSWKVLLETVEQVTVGRKVQGRKK